MKQPSCPAVVGHIVEYRSNERLVAFLEDIKSRIPGSRLFPASQVSQTGGRLLRLSTNVQHTVAGSGRLVMDEPNLQVSFLMLDLSGTRAMCYNGDTRSVWSQVHACNVQ